MSDTPWSWNYLGFNITVDKDGYFVLEGHNFKAKSLDALKKKILQFKDELNITIDTDENLITDIYGDETLCKATGLYRFGSYNNLEFEIQSIDGDHKEYINERQICIVNDKSNIVKLINKRAELSKKRNSLEDEIDEIGFKITAENKKFKTFVPSVKEEVKNEG